jgi:hypothetical protein
VEDDLFELLVGGKETEFELAHHIIDDLPKSVQGLGSRV